MGCVLPTLRVLQLRAFASGVACDPAMEAGITDRVWSVRAVAGTTERAIIQLAARSDVKTITV